jgi:excisionase family DNA binding protein
MQDPSLAPVQRLSTVPELAREWGVCERTIWRLIADGELEALRIRRAVRVTPESQSRYLRRARRK